MKKEISFEELRKIQLDMMKVIHQFCIDNNIRYSLGGGTLLGAVRHKGFIPWDDDIDIMMPRPDYERFIKEFDGKFSHYRVQHYKNDMEYNFAFGKVIDNRTVIYENTCKTGVYIDIFPIDGMPAEKYYTKTVTLNKKLRRLLILLSSYGKIEGEKQFLKRMIRMFVSRKTALKIYELYLKAFNFERSKYAGAIVGLYEMKEHMPAATFKSYINLDFEGESFMGIKDYDQYLTKHYGSYMKLPPIEKQKRPHANNAYYII